MMKQYLFKVIAVVVGLVLVTLGLTILVDPYLTFGMHRVDGVTAKKPFAGDRPLEAKRALIARRSFDSLYIGDSRIDVAFDPSAAANQLLVSNGFNLGVPGSDLVAVARNFEGVKGRGPWSHVVLGIDYIEFVTPVRKLPDEAPFPLRSFVERTLSLTAVNHSLQTVARQRGTWTNSMSNQGFTDRRSMAMTVRTQGALALFQEKNRTYNKRLSRLSGVEADRLAAMNENLAVLSDLLDDMAAQSQHVWVFGHPYHAQLHRLLERHGISDGYTVWQQRVSALVEIKIRQYPDIDFRLLNFPRFNQWSVEPVIGRGILDQAPEHYWESVHYKSSVGAEILRLFSLPECLQSGLSVQVSRPCVSPLMTIAEPGSDVISGISE